MAAGLGFKTFNTGDVLSAGDTNGYLMQGVWVFASATARDAAVTSPQEGNMCYLKDTDAVQSYSGSAWVAVGANSSGKVLQVVTAQSTTSTTIASTTYTDTTLTATITPTLNTSKILVLVSQAVQYTIPATLISIGAVILRGATTIFDAGLSADRLKATGTTAVEHALRLDMKYIDSPATTSATTYKTQGRLAATGSGESSTWQPVSPFGGTAAPSTIILMEIGA